MNKIDLLDDRYKQTSAGAFFSPDEVGKTLQGTYVDKTQRPNNYKPGEWTDYYVIKTDEGDFLIRDFPTIKDHMEGMRKGTLVAFKYIGNKKPKDPGKQPYKDIEVFYDKKIVDKEWLAENEELDTAAEFANDEPKNDVPFEGGNFQNGAPLPAPAVTVEEPAALEVGPSVGTVATVAPSVEGTPEPTMDKKGLIVELAKKRFGVTTEQEALVKVMEETGLAVVEKQYDTIIELLEI